MLFFFNYSNGEDVVRSPSQLRRENTIALIS